MKINLWTNNLYRNIFLSFCVKGVAIIVGVIMMPAYLDYFSNVTILGVWFALLSFLTWISFFDLGIGNGMRNNIARLLVLKNYSMIQQIISSAYISIALISIFLAMFGLMAIYTVNLNQILNIDPKIIPVNTLRIVMTITLMGVVCNFFLKLISSILNAMGKTALTSFLPLSSNIMVLAFISFNIQLSEPEKLLLLSFVYILSINIPYVFTTFYIFRKSLQNACPKIDKCDYRIARDILSLGGKFFGIQCMFMIITATNELIISIFFSPADVVEFQIYNKIFYTIVVLFAVITNPVWSSITTAFYSKAYKHIMKTYNRMFYSALLVGVLICLIAYKFQFIVDIWLKDNAIVVSPFALVSFCIYITALAFCFAESSIANGISKLNTQILGYTFAAFSKVVIMILLSKYRDYFNWYIIIFANGLCLFPYIIAQHLVLKQEFIKYSTQGNKL